MGHNVRVIKGNYDLIISRRTPNDMNAALSSIYSLKELVTGCGKLLSEAKAFLGSVQGLALCRWECVCTGKGFSSVEGGAQSLTLGQISVRSVSRGV